MESVGFKFSGFGFFLLSNDFGGVRDGCLVAGVDCAVVSINCLDEGVDCLCASMDCVDVSVDCFRLYDNCLNACGNCLAVYDNCLHAWSDCLDVYSDCLDALVNCLGTNMGLGAEIVVFEGLEEVLGWFGFSGGVNAFVFTSSKFYDVLVCERIFEADVEHKNNQPVYRLAAWFSSFRLLLD